MTEEVLKREECKDYEKYICNYRDILVSDCSRFPVSILRIEAAILKKQHQWVEKGYIKNQSLASICKLYSWTWNKVQFYLWDADLNYVGYASLNKFTFEEFMKGNDEDIRIHSKQFGV